MMLGELLTGLFAVEAFMSIETGKSTNYVEDQRNAELAVVRPLDSETTEERGDVRHLPVE